ncbi:MAG: neutral/alkaline non-lysosomal ceramidase N-terminal domain-containing protein [Planctomycetota bacterium]
MTTVTPGDRQEHVPKSAWITVAFGQAVDTTTVTPQTVALFVAGRAVPARQVVEARRVTIVPDHELVAREVYEVRVLPGVTSTSGAALPQALTTTFLTEATARTRGPILTAGAAIVDITPPIGVPLGGHGGGRRRLAPNQYDLDPTNFHTMFAPSTGTRDPIYARAVVIDDGVDRVAIVSTDLIASDNRAAAEVSRLLQARGVPIDPERILYTATHNHSGPGTVSELRFWELAAMDLHQPQVFTQITRGMADAVEAALRELQPARLGIGTADLTGVAINRRAWNPFYGRDTLDPALSVIRIDRPDGAPIATIMNYAIHIMAFGSSNMEYSADIAGEACTAVEAQVGGLALFVNSAEGDIKPDPSIGINDDDRLIQIGQTIGQAAVALRNTTLTSPDLELDSASETVNMGTPSLFVSSADQSSAPAFISNVLAAFPGGIGIAIPMNANFMDNTFRFQAIRMNDTVLSSVPGEAIHEVGFGIKAKGGQLGFARTIVCGLANGHMSYITTEREYNLRGYESVATLFGPKTGEKVIEACRSVMSRVAP